ncbi:hypothetical protein Mal52_12010 [Symmachiella dynata]|uniref:DUF1559 domain-containing protein n=1 Tax=Symmachiella dynata TaxID=2527995 RepID=A0A517ZJT8_9PLAN|nr:DUF1559 domain-containing protein [Symmachiella dynata]QDU42734.1 hypothetical protein Mal52_12010 [Symmachiella dynata]
MNVREFPFRRWIPVLVVGGVLLLVIGLLLPAVQRARTQARKTQSVNRLKNIGLGVHNCYNGREVFPSGGVIRDDGVAMHGWLSEVYLRTVHGIFEVNFHRPWDDLENDPWVRQRIDWFENPAISQQLSHDGYGLTHYMGNPNVFHRNSSVTFEDLTAGLSHTWLAGEVTGNFHPWAYPFNWRALGERLNDEPNGFGRPTEDGAYFVLADGGVKFFGNAMGEEVLRNLANAPPIATPEQTVIPTTRVESETCNWKYEEIDLQPASADGVSFAKVWIDGAGTPQTVSLICRTGDWNLIRGSGCRLMTEQEFQRLHDKYPGIRKLYGLHGIDDASAQMIAQFEDLEFLETKRIQLSATGLQALQKLSQLKIMRVRSWHRTAGEELRAALPDCEIRGAGQLPDDVQPFDWLKW